MRAFVLLPLAAMAFASCGYDSGEQVVRSVPKRDLTLVTQSLESAVASVIETEQPRTQSQAARASRPARRRVVRRSPHVTPVHLVSTSIAASAAAVLEPIVRPVSAPSSSDNSRELLPGKTVTVIPASSGPSPATETGTELPPEQGRPMVRAGGGRCGGRGRGPGIGIATAPRPDFR